MFLFPSKQEVHSSSKGRDNGFLHAKQDYEKVVSAKQAWPNLWTTNKTCMNDQINKAQQTYTETYANLVSKEALKMPPMRDYNFGAKPLMRERGDA